ncbi:MAG TPA: ADP-ribosylation factor-like protein [Candidatus Gastranaerophilales bacterium]|nr:ADP-ribosylation factor-like protein [Candidatus Gastranaerophilales bacterium]
MVLVNYADRKLTCKIVYYGTGESGKTSNLSYIHNTLDSTIRSDMTCLEGLNERTLFFDFLSINLGDVKGFNTTFSLYTTPGQMEYNAARKIILNGVDGVVFVADSSPDRRNDNIISFKNMMENFKEFNLLPENVPVVLQYNKRDLPNLLSFEDLENDLNKAGFPSYEAVAIEGRGVFATLKSVSNSILKNLQ